MGDNLRKHRLSSLPARSPADGRPARRLEKELMTDSTRREKHTEDGSSRHGGKRRARGWVVALALVTLGAAGGALTTIAVDAGAHGRWHHGHRMHGRGIAADPQRMIERVQHASAWVLGSVDATDEQRERVDAILASVVNDLFPLRDEHLVHHRDLIAELARPEVDFAKLERVRTAELGLVDQASARLLDATVAITEVLDAEQRRQLVEEFAEHRHYRH